MSPYLKDLAERTAMAALGGALTALLAHQSDLLSLDVWEGAGLAAMSGGIEFLRGALARTVGDSDSAGFVRR